MPALAYRLLLTLPALPPACDRHAKLETPELAVLEHGIWSRRRTSCPVPVIDRLWPLDITRLDAADVPAAARGAWQVIAAIRASTSETQIVAGTKTLHHVLPDLMPPIDRQCTFRFFTGQKQIPPGDQRAFLEWFPYLAEIGRSCRGAIEIAMNRGGPMASGPAKVIDNAIIGFMQAQDTRPASPTSNPDDHHI